MRILDGDEEEQLLKTPIVEHLIPSDGAAESIPRPATRKIVVNPEPDLQDISSKLADSEEEHDDILTAMEKRWGRAQTLPGRSNSPPSNRVSLPAFCSAHPENAETPAALERFEMIKPIGHGGMGVVYEARDTRLQRRVAIKFIRRVSDYDFRRFQQEARAQARIDHNNICKVYEAGEMEGMPYLAMELLEGKPLNTIKRRLTLEEKLRVVRDIAGALHSAHRIGIIHRDIKPGNIMIVRREDHTLRPVIMDFGLAFDIETGHEITRPGMVIGTPAYMSPEQAVGTARNIDARSDIYSLGAVLYELLSGKPPFVGDSSVAILGRITLEDPVPLRRLLPSLPTALDVITMKCLEKEPARRYASSLELAADLQRYLDAQPIVARGASLPERTLRWTRSRLPMVALALGFLIMSMLSVGLLLRAHRLANEHAAELMRQSELTEKLNQTLKQMETYLRCAQAPERLMPPL